MERLNSVLGHFRLNTNHQTITIKEEPQEDRRTQVLRDLCLPDPPPTFETFVTLHGTEDAFNAFKALAEGNGLPMLLCYGRTGNGKTHLMQALMLEFHRQGIFARYLTWPKVIMAFRRGQLDGAIPHYYDILEIYCRTETPLVIDDIGAGTTGTDREWADLEEIVNARYNDRLVTVMATNLTPDQLPPRVVSRFRYPNVSRIVLNDGEDYRKMKARGEL